jgi:hypothetical protein
LVKDAAKDAVKVKAKEPEVYKGKYKFSFDVTL